MSRDPNNPLDLGTSINDIKGLLKRRFYRQVYLAIASEKARRKGPALKRLQAFYRRLTREQRNLIETAT